VLPAYANNNCVKHGLGFDNLAIVKIEKPLTTSHRIQSGRLNHMRLNLNPVQPQLVSQRLSQEFYPETPGSTSRPFTAGNRNQSALTRR
jgi:hypothetical protein